MKSAMFRKDNAGAVVGKLKSPTEIQYENNGKIEIFSLTGNIVETQYNDVIVLGRKIDDTHMEVHKMESLPKLQEPPFGLKGTDNEKPVYSLCIPKDIISNIEQHIDTKGKLYHTVHAVAGNTTYFISVFGEFTENTINDCYVFLMTDAPKIEHSEFGKGYAVKKRTTVSTIGYQVAS